MDGFSAQGCLPAGSTWEPVTGGESGALIFQRAEGDLFAKCVPLSKSEVLADERDRIAWLAMHGVPGATVAGWSVGAEGACLLTTAVSGVPAGVLGPRDLLRAWPFILEVTRRLHEIPTDACPFERRLDTMIAAADEVVARGAVTEAWLRPEQRGRPYSELLDEIVAQRLRRNEQEAIDLVVVHGDACLPNFLIDPETSACTGLIDLGRLGLADRHADLALLWSSLTDRVAPAEAQAAYGDFARHYGAGLVDLDRLVYYVHLDPLTW